MAQFPVTRGGWFLGFVGRFAIDDGVFAEGMSIVWHASFLKTLIEEFGVVDWAWFGGLLAENGGQVIDAIDTKCSRGCLQISQEYIHLVLCFDKARKT